MTDTVWRKLNWSFYIQQWLSEARFTLDTLFLVLTEQKLAQLGQYHKVPSKRPWALRAQAQKIRGGPLHEEPAQITSWQAPTPDFLIYLDEAIIYKCVQRKLQQCKIVALHQSDCSVKLLLPFLSQLSDKIKVNTSVSFSYACH